jgi:hypothetical protein
MNTSFDAKLKDVNDFSRLALFQLGTHLAQYFANAESFVP